MTTATDNPPPEPGVFEQIFAWLETWPSVPNSVQWLAVMTGVALPMLLFLWRRWGANRWAARSRDAAERRAEKLGRDVIQVHRLSRNRAAMFALGFVSLAEFTMSCSLAVIAIIVKATQPNSDLGLIPLVGAYGGFFHFAYMSVRLIMPLADIDRYTRRSRTRIEALLTKARVPREIAAERVTEFDAEIEAVRKREIT